MVWYGMIPSLDWVCLASPQRNRVWLRSCGLRRHRFHFWSGTVAVLKYPPPPLRPPCPFFVLSGYPYPGIFLFFGFPVGKLDFRANSEEFRMQVWSGPVRHFRSGVGTDQTIFWHRTKICVRLLRGYGLVLGERYGMVWYGMVWYVCMYSTYIYIYVYVFMCLSLSLYFVSFIFTHTVTRMQHAVGKHAFACGRTS